MSNLLWNAYIEARRMDTHHMIRSVCSLCIPRDVDLSSSLPSLVALQFQDALEICQEARAKVKVLCYRNSQIKTDTHRALELF